MAITGTPFFKAIAQIRVEQHEAISFHKKKADLSASAAHKFFAVLPLLALGCARLEVISHPPSHVLCSVYPAEPAPQRRISGARSKIRNWASRYRYYVDCAWSEAKGGFRRTSISLWRSGSGLFDRHVCPANAPSVATQATASAAARFPLIKGLLTLQDMNGARAFQRPGTESSARRCS
jgi:hypothetical protein